MPASQRNNLTGLLYFALAALAGLACGDRATETEDFPSAGGKADDAVLSPTGLDSRPSNFTCVAPDRPSTSSAITHRRAFQNLSFTQPVLMKQPPQSNRWYVVEKRGVVWSFADDEATTQPSVVLDHRSRVNSQPNEAGLLGLAFHPDFAQNGVAFLSYNLNSNGKLFSLISRIVSSDGGQTFDPGSETQVLAVEQPFSNHNGGNIEFGPDGYLYIGFGDGGSADDPHGNGQNKNTMLGAMLRIDIDAPGAYGIPTDNPFANGAGRPEIYAYGLRNPWRFSFDQSDGKLWLADVGQDDFEEVDIIVKGGNYGWNRKEGDNCFADPFPCDSGVIDPVGVYNHDAGDRSITGGFVYRGSDLPALDGSYLFGDFVTGRVWRLRPVGQGYQREFLFNAGVNISSFAQGHDGEVFMLSYGDGNIRKIAPEGGGSASFPTRLSETGCFDPSDPRQPTSGVIPYDVNAPLWSDGAGKERFMALPQGKRIHIAPDGDFEFPTGSVLIKTFWLANRRIETRLMVRHDDGGWAGYAYKWNFAQTEATLVSGRDTFQVGTQSWTIPSQADCNSCHTAAAKFALGPEIAQLNDHITYPATGRTSNQIDTLAHIGYFDNSPSGAATLPSLPRYDDDASSVESRVRGYLHSNCSSCHRPGGPGRSDADMRFQGTSDAMGLCNVLPETGNFGVVGARLLVPGDPEKSLISLRMHTLTGARMPGLGTSRVDPTGTALVDSWINSIASCSTGGGGTTGNWSGLNEAGALSQNQEDHFATPVLPAGVYRFDLSGTGDADLYVRGGAAPNTQTFDCRPFLEGSTETCSLQLPAPMSLHIMVRGYASSSNYQLLGAAQ